MELNIGETIKRLRREKNITQERLAEHLNISTQAVSKWERNETYPDITMVLPLAGYFGVSADELLGFDAAKNELKIKEYLDGFRLLAAQGKTKEEFDLMCAAYKEFPNDFRIIEEYMWQLNYDPNCKGTCGNEVHRDELYSLCFRVLDECTLDSPRYSALSILSGLYLIDGDREKAIETANRLPDPIFTKNAELANCYDEDSAEWWKVQQENIREWCEQLQVDIRKCALCDSVPVEEQIRLLEKSVAVIELIYDEGDYGFQYYELSNLYHWIANRYVQLGELEKAVEYYDRGFACAAAYDNLPVVSKHTSALVDRLEQDMRKVFSGSEDNWVKYELDWLKSCPQYETVKDLDSFMAVIAKYEPLSGSKSYFE